MGQGNIFRSVCQEFCPQGGAIPACIAGGISACLAVGGAIPACLAAGGAWSGGCLLPGGLLPGVTWAGGCALGGGVWSGGVPGPGGAWWRSPGTATAAGGTHPTGMHSCAQDNDFYQQSDKLSQT